MGEVSTTTATETARLFVGVIPPAPVLDVIESVERTDRPGLRWTTRAQWHITLRFLGTVPIASARNRLAAVGAGRPAGPIEATLGPRIVRFGRGIVAVRVAGLDELAAAVDAAFEPLVGVRRDHDFAGHLTLARERRRGEVPALGRRMSASFEVASIDLVASETHPDGARYTVIASQEL